MFLIYTVIRIQKIIKKSQHYLKIKKIFYFSDSDGLGYNNLNFILIVNLSVVLNKFNRVTKIAQADSKYQAYSIRPDFLI